MIYILFGLNILAVTPVLFGVSYSLIFSKKNESLIGGLDGETSLFVLEPSKMILGLLLIVGLAYLSLLFFLLNDLTPRENELHASTNREGVTH